METQLCEIPPDFPMSDLETCVILEEVPESSDKPEDPLLFPSFVYICENRIGKNSLFKAECLNFLTPKFSSLMVRWEKKIWHSSSRGWEKPFHVSA